MSGRKVHSIRGNWCRVYVARCPYVVNQCQRVKTATGAHPFFNQQQTYPSTVCLEISLKRVHVDLTYKKPYSNADITWSIPQSK